MTPEEEWHSRSPFAHTHPHIHIHMNTCIHIYRLHNRMNSLINKTTKLVSSQVLLLSVCPRDSYNLKGPLSRSPDTEMKSLFWTLAELQPSWAHGTCGHMHKIKPNQRSHTEWGGVQKSSSVMGGDLWIAGGFQRRERQFPLWVWALPYQPWAGE